MSIAPPHKAYLSVALALALSACGGGESGQAGHGSTPANQSAGGNGTGSGVPASTPGADRALRQPKAISKTLLPPISSTGIRGDVLAQALRTQTSEHTAGGRRLMDRAVPWTEEFPKGKRNTRKTSPEFFIDQTITQNAADSGLDGTFLYTYDPFPRVVGKEFPPAEHAALTHRFGISAEGLLDSNLGQAALDTEVLRLGNRMEVLLYPEAASTASRQATQRQTLDAPRATAPIRLNQEIEWLHPVYRWGAWGDPGESTFVEMFIRQGEKPDQFQLCLFSSVFWQIAQQQGCSVWEVPAGWAPGQALIHRGQTITQERTNDFPAYWHAPAGSPKHDPDGRQDTTAHTSDEGISGAVLAAMFDVWSPRGQGMQSFRTLQAVETQGKFGPPDTTDPLMPKLAYQTTRVTQYADGASTGDYSTAVGTYLYAVRSGEVPSPTIALPALAVFAFPQTTLALNLRNEHRDGVNVLTLPAWLGLDVMRQIAGTGDRQWTYREELLDRPATTIAASELVRYGNVIKSWHTPGRKDEIVSLRLERDSQGSSWPVLCWKVFLDEARAHVSRDLCTRWHVPADWQPGQKLTPESYSIQDGLWLEKPDQTGEWHKTYYWSNR